MKISVFKAGSQVFYTIFDAIGSDKETWIERSRVLKSSATDMLTEIIMSTDFFVLRRWVP